jgi:hypothetical protein
MGLLEMTDTVAIDVVVDQTPVIEVIAGVGQQGPPGPAWQPGFTNVTASGRLPFGTNGLALVDTTSGPLTVTLPPAPALSQSLTIKDANGFAGSGNPITVAGGGFTIEGELSLVIDSNYGWVQLAFTGVAWVQV